MPHAPRIITHLALSVLLLFTGQVMAMPGTTIDLSPCHLSAPMMPVRIRAECGRFSVPEDYDAPHGKRIELAVAVLPAMGRKPATDPLVFISGGPGQSALESWVSVAGAFQRVRRERDVLLVDQRGTGGSNALRCDFEEDSMGLLPDKDEIIETMQDCLASLDADPRHYTTSVAVRDLDAVRAALGYDRVNLYGISYGTRVAQAYMQKFPDRARTVILDGVVPQDLALGPDISLDAQRALDLMFTRCEQDDACAERFPNLEERFKRLQSRLRGAPVELVLADPNTGELRDFSFSELHFTAVVRMFSYAPETVSLLPLLIDHAEQTGDFAPLAAQALLVASQLGESIATGMHNAVVCTEDVPFVTRGASADARMLQTYLGLQTMDFLQAVCAVWPQGVMDEEFKTPLSSDIPTLLLSGEADPVTPPGNGEHASVGLSDSLHLVGNGQGHGMAIRGCTPRLMADFISAGTTANLDASCLDRLRPSPFFMRFTGPDP